MKTNTYQFRKRYLYLLFPSLLAPDLATGQPIYKCTDSAGKTSYNATPCTETTPIKILNGPKPEPQRAEAAPVELVAAYKQCLTAIYQNNFPMFFSCFTRREGESRRERHGSKPKFQQNFQNMTVTPILGKLDKVSGVGSMLVRTYSGDVEEFLSIDFFLESNQWKVEKITDAPVKPTTIPPGLKDFKICAPYVKSCN